MTFNPTQDELKKALRPEEHDPIFPNVTVGWCRCGVLTSLGIGCVYVCSHCKAKRQKLNTENGAK